MRAVLLGLVFGLLVGGLMRLPSKETLVDAFAANLSVMAALWLGALAAKGAERGVIAREVLVALFTFGCAAAAFQGQVGFLYVGFVVQIIWSLLHYRGRLGVAVLRGYPAFMASVNLAFLIVFPLLDRLT